MNRADVTEMILSAKKKKGVSFADIAKKIGQSKEGMFRRGAP